MKILVCGDRYWNQPEVIREVLSMYNKDTTIIQGLASGADIQAKTIAKELGLKVLDFPADWNKFGKAAGPIRNRQMLDEKPDLVLAFHNNLENSRGTKDCVNEARKRKIRVTVIVTGSMGIFSYNP